jgi:hypothetical protein
LLVYDLNPAKVLCQKINDYKIDGCKNGRFLEHTWPSTTAPVYLAGSLAARLYTVFYANNNSFSFLISI